MPYDINELLKLMHRKNASDLHISSNSNIKFRIDVKLVPYDDHTLSPKEAKDLIYTMLTSEQIKQFEKEMELDFSFGLENISRYRVNVFKQRESVCAAIRLIPYHIMSFEECGLPADIVINQCRKPKGLVIVTGATGSGKSTTLASMIDWINDERDCHIITIEDPIEFVHANKKAIVDQRQVHTDTHSFGAALKHVLRQDPDVILIGEMRDLETIESALIIAETGHLVFATLHTSDCVQSINRVLDVFPAYQQQQIRTQLSFVLNSILSQQLIPKLKGPGRVLATEVLIATPAVRSLIREAKIHQIYSVIQTSHREGMKTMNQALFELHQGRVISSEEAFARTMDGDELRRLFNR